MGRHSVDVRQLRGTADTFLNVIDAFGAVGVWAPTSGDTFDVRIRHCGGLFYLMAFGNPAHPEDLSAWRKATGDGVEYVVSAQCIHPAFPAAPSAGADEGSGEG